MFINTSWHKAPVIAIYLAVAKIWDQSSFQATDFSLLLKLPWSQLVFCVFENVLQCESKDGGVLDLLEVEEESNLPLKGAPGARLGEKEPQQVLDPVNCLPVHL